MVARRSVVKAQGRGRAARPRVFREYVYAVQPATLVGVKPFRFKIGRSKNKHGDMRRLKAYGKDRDELSVIYVDDSVATEKILKKTVRLHFHSVKVNKNGEYFQCGDKNRMVRLFNSIVRDEEPTSRSAYNLRSSQITDYFRIT